MKNIAVIRQSISMVVSMLTNRSIEVTQRGSKAYVSYHPKTGAIILVNIPYLPDNASEDFVAAVQGFLDHEVGHVLFTDFATLKKAAAAGGRIKNLHNVIEDVLVERKMASAFQGSAGNLNAVRSFYLNKIAKPKILEAMKAGDSEKAAGYASVIQFRAWGGQTIAFDFLTDHPAIAALVKPMGEKIGASLIAEITKMETSADALKLAVSIMKALEPPKPKPEPKAEPPKPKAKPEPKPEPKPSEPEPPEPPEPPSEDAPSEADSPEPDSETTPGLDVPGEGYGDMESKHEEPESEKESDSGDDLSDTDPSSDFSDDEPSDEEEASSGGASDADDADDDGEAVGASEGGEAEGRPGAGSGVSDADDADDEPAPSDEDDLGSAFDEEQDFDKDMSEGLSKAAKGELSKSPYKVYSTDWDSVEPGPMAKYESSVGKMVDACDHMIAGIQKTLERSMAAKSRKAWSPGQRRGRISPGALFRTATGDDRVFRTRYETQSKDTAVSLLVDCSSSMLCGDRIGTAALAAYALSSTLERLKIKNEVLGFTTRINREMTKSMSTESGSTRYSRVEAIYMPVFKSFEERLTVESKSRIAALTESPGWVNQNVDGECVQMAAQRLAMQPTQRHVLIVLSDGEPACPGNQNALDEHLKKVVADLTKDGRIEVIGVGIQNGAVSRYYPKSLNLSDISKLPETVVSELAKLLLK